MQAQPLGLTKFRLEECQEKLHELELPISSLKETVGEGRVGVGGPASVCGAAVAPTDSCPHPVYSWTR